jgi:hypothetical protein
VPACVWLSQQPPSEQREPAHAHCPLLQVPLQQSALTKHLAWLHEPVLPPPPPGGGSTQPQLDEVQVVLPPVGPSQPRQTAQPFGPVAPHGLVANGSVHARTARLSLLHWTSWLYWLRPA